MAEINVKNEVAFEREKVFWAFRDKLQDLLSYLPDVEDIKVLEREEIDENTIKLLNLWQANYDQVPKAARGFIKPEMLKWKDHATWRQDEWICEWVIEPDFLSDAISCQGKNSFIDKGDGKTEVIISGNLEIDVKKIKGVPKLGSGKIGKIVEDFAVPMISSNLGNVVKGLESYLQSE